MIHKLENPRVTGSIPVRATNLDKPYRDAGVFHAVSWLNSGTCINFISYKHL